jgi:hypothetical protein
MKKLLIGLISAVLLTFVGATSVKAITPPPQPINTSYDFTTTDNGMQGLWATDTFHSTLVITKIGKDEYRIARTDTGTFEVLSGAKSPGGVDGTLVGDGTKGTISGGVTVVIKGHLKDNIPATNGPEDLREAKGDYFHKYFSIFFEKDKGKVKMEDEGNTIESWGWTFTTCNNGTWVDNDETESAYPEGTAMGDIKGTYVPCEQPAEPVSNPQSSGNSFSEAGAPVCQGFQPAMIPNAFAKRITATNSVIGYWPTVVGGQVNIRFRELGATEWQHALRDYPNLGVAPIGFLKDGVKYEYQLTNGYGCNQSPWSKVYKPL